MAKIHSLKISNFRGLKTFEQVFGDAKFVCIIGRGDSGKSSILDAISYVLSPSWNLTFLDTDFYDCDIETPIEIEASIYDFPQELLRESKYGLHIRGLDKATQTVHDELSDGQDPLLTINLCIDKDLEPKWQVINGREGQESIEIKARDRARLNAFLVSDYVDRHFSWNYGSPLYSLLRQEENWDGEKDNNILIKSLREAKEKIDSNSFEHLDSVVDKIKNNASSLGIDITDTSTTIDFRDFLIKDSKVCLHEEKIPFRLKGKGSKRLISMAIQLEYAKAGGIVLIDEIEQGLEPDRVQHLAKTLKESDLGQFFITTHSRDVLVELETENLFLMKRGAPRLQNINSLLQGCIRSNPEAFFSERILVCEGATEVGICRALNAFRIQQGKSNATFKGVRFIDGRGSSIIEYSQQLKSAGYDVCIFCDSDVKAVNDEKPSLLELGIKIVDCDSDNSIEKQIFTDLPWDGIKDLIEYRISQKSEESVNSSMKAQLPELENGWQDIDSVDIRNALAAAATVRNKDWFKRTDHGIALGEICCKYLDKMTDEKLKQEFEELSVWIDNA